MIMNGFDLIQQQRRVAVRWRLKTRLTFEQNGPGGHN